ncbi:MAG: ATP-binding protein [Brachybacterium sp.]|nr:ATP-binding protein [Brachybacterium sp.]
MTVPRVHLLYGLSGSGKTTHARRLSADGAAVRFTLDEWMLRLHPELSFDDDRYGERIDQVKDLIWSVADQVLAAGVDVVLDWNSWSRQRRSWAVTRARAAGVSVVLHRLLVGVDDASDRAEGRTRSNAAYAHPVTAAHNVHLASLMEEPAPEEGFEIRDVT